jgi:hypothetical protein
MALETGTYISDLVITNPTASDLKSQGDDHLRLIKSTIKATFPNFTAAALAATQTQLDKQLSVCSVDAAAPAAAIAVAASGAVSLSQVLTVTAYQETAPVIANSGTAVTLALAGGTVLSYTLTGNCTFTMPAATSGTSFMVKLIQDGTGSRTATFTGVKWPAAVAPTVTPTATTGTSLIGFVCINSIWYGNASMGFA